MIDCLSSTDSMRGNFKCKTCKGGRQKIEHSERIVFHPSRDGDDRLVSQDVSGWWVAGAIFRRATGITT